MLDAGVLGGHNRVDLLGGLEYILSPSDEHKKQTSPFYKVYFSPSEHDIIYMRLLLEPLFERRRFSDQELHTLYQLAVLQQQAGKIDPEVTIYTPFMGTDILSSLKAGDRIYHPNPQWVGKSAHKRWDNEGKFISLNGVDLDTKNGSYCAILVKFPYAGVKKLAVNVHESTTFSLWVWGWYIAPGLQR